MNLHENKKSLSDGSAREKDRPLDCDYSLRYIRCLLRILGIWPLVCARPMRIEYYFSKFALSPLISLSMMSLTAPVCYYVIARPIDRIETIVLLGPITCQIANILIHLAMILRANMIKICIENIKDDWQRIENSNERDILTRYVHFSHGLTIACITFMYSAALSYSLIMPLLSGNTINEMNETVRPRPFPGTEIFFDVQANVVYEIVFVANFISALFHYTVSSALCILAIVLVGHACGQIQIIIFNLTSFIDRINGKEDASDLIATQMGLIIRRHVRLLKFSMHIERALREMILVEVVASTLIICFIEYNILIILEANCSDRMGMFTYSMLFLSFAFNLFLYCQFGEIIRGQCEKIGKTAYLIDWFKLPGRTKLALIMIINISHQPCKLTAGGMMDLSIINFASILKTSFAYFNMMRTMG